VDVYKGTAGRQGQGLMRLGPSGARASREELRVQLDSRLLSRARLRA